MGRSLVARRDQGESGSAGGESSPRDICHKLSNDFAAADFGERRIGEPEGVSPPDGRVERLTAFSLGHSLSHAAMSVC